MRCERGDEVYVVFEGVFALDEAVDPDESSWVTLATPDGLRVRLPIAAVADWDVHCPVAP